MNHDLIRRYFSVALSVLRYLALAMEAILQPLLLTIVPLWALNLEIYQETWSDRLHFWTYYLVYVLIAAVLIFHNREERRHTLLRARPTLEAGGVPGLAEDFLSLVTSPNVLSFCGVSLVLSLVLRFRYVELESAVLGIEQQEIPTWMLSRFVPLTHLMKGELPREGIPSLGQHLLLIVLPELLIQFFLFFIAHRYYYASMASKEYQYLEEERPGVRRLLLNTLLLGASLAVMMMALPIYASFVVSILRFLTRYGTVLLLILAGIWLLYRGIGILRVIVKRNRFLTRLKKTCRLHGFALELCAHPIAETFRQTPGATFTVDTGKTCYAVKMISALHPLLPVLIEDDGSYLSLHLSYFSHRQKRSGEHHFLGRGKNVLQSGRSGILDFGIRSSIAWEDEGTVLAESGRTVKKILLFNPTPRNVYAGDLESCRLVDIGDPVMNGAMELWTGNAFCNWLDRE